MKVLITGGAGFIGVHLARAHLGRGDAVVLIDNLFKTQGAGDPEWRTLLAHPAARWVRHDLTQPLPAAELPERTFDVVYHLAAINGTQLFYEIPYEVARTNVLSTIHLLDALGACHVGRLIYSSSSEVYAGAESLGRLPIPTDEQVPVVFTQPTPVRFSYGTSKFMGEVLCDHFGRRAGVPVTLVRYHNIYGPRMGERHVIPEFIARARRKEDPFDVYGGRETRAFCYVDDAVEATLRVAAIPACAGEILHIGNAAEETRIKDLATIVLELTGHRAALRLLPSREGSVSRRCPDITKLTRLTAFEPRVGLREGLQRMIGWMSRTSVEKPAVPVAVAARRSH